MTLKFCKPITTVNTEYIFRWLNPQLVDLHLKIFALNLIFEHEHNGLKIHSKYYYQVVKENKKKLSAHKFIFFLSEKYWFWKL